MVRDSARVTDPQISGELHANTQGYRRKVVGHMNFTRANGRGVVLDEARVGHAIAEGLPIGVDAAPENL